MERKLREKELEVKKAELADQANRAQEQQQNQNMQTLLLQQQQQQSTAMIALIKSLSKKTN